MGAKRFSVALGSSKTFSPALVWVRDFSFKPFLVESETKNLELSKLLFDFISSCLTDELIEKRGFAVVTSTVCVQRKFLTIHSS